MYKEFEMTDDAVIIPRSSPGRNTVAIPLEVLEAVSPFSLIDVASALRYKNAVSGSTARTWLTARELIGADLTGKVIAYWDWEYDDHETINYITDVVRVELQEKNDHKTVFFVGDPFLYRENTLQFCKYNASSENTGGYYSEMYSRTLLSSVEALSEQAAVMGDMDFDDEFSGFQLDRSFLVMEMDPEVVMTKRNPLR